MRAFVLAGGLGTRLRAALPDRPKALAPVGGRPFLEWQLEILRKEGIREVVLCTGHLAPAIAAAVGDGSRHGLRVLHSVEPEPLGTAGALRHAARLLDGTLLVLNGDTLVTGFREPLEETHRRLGAAATLALARSPDPRSGGVVEMDARGRVLGFAEKPASPPPGALVNAGVWLLEPDVVLAIPPRRAVSLEREVLPGLIRAGETVAGAVLPRGFLDLGTPEGYREVEAAFAMGARG